MLGRRQRKRAIRALPTTSLYLRDALAGFSLDWEKMRCGEHIFRFKEKSVVVRYADFDELHRLKEPFIYIVDDDFPAIIRDPNLPADYRQRIEDFVEGPWLKIAESAEEIVVPNHHLQSQYREMGCKTRCLSPFWKVAGSQAPKKPSSNRGVKIAWLASRAHQVDLESIRNSLENVFRENREASFTLFAGKHISDWMMAIPRLKNLPPRPWPAYRDWLRRNRFDIVIHPLLETPVNRARSVSKWKEISSTGAAPLISNRSPWKEWLSDEDGSFFLVEDGNWAATLSHLIQNPSERFRLAARAHEIAVAANEKARREQTDYWTDQLNLTD